MLLLLRVSMNCVELNKNVVDDDVKTLEGFLWSELP